MRFCPDGCSFATRGFFSRIERRIPAVEIRPSAPISLRFGGPGHQYRRVACTRLSGHATQISLRTGRAPEPVKPGGDRRRASELLRTNSAREIQPRVIGRRADESESEMVGVLPGHFSDERAILPLRREGQYSVSKG